MELKDLTPEVIESSLEGFYQVMSKHLAYVAKEMGNESMSIPRVPRKMGIHEFSYFFAAELDQLFRYSLGGLSAQISFVNRMCDMVESLLFTTPHGERVTPDKGWYDTPVGFAVSVSRARVHLRTDGAQVTLKEIQLMSNLSAADLQEDGLTGDGPFPSEKLQFIFEKRHIPV